MIEVSGVRRSWETERSSEVLSSSLRRSAPASIASACMRSRSREQLLQLGQRAVGLLAPALGLGGAGAGELGQGPAGDGDDREDGQGDEVVVGGDVERADRRQVEPVEGGGAEQRRAAGPAAAPTTVEISSTPGM